MDAGFGASGAVELDDRPQANLLRAVTVQRDGRIVAVGKRSGLGLMVVRVDAEPADYDASRQAAAEVPVALVRLAHARRR